MTGRLNLFQASMLRWRALHPYNAVHLVRIDRPLDAARLAAIVDRQLPALGLTGFVLDARRRRYAYRGGPARTALAVHAGGAQPTRTLEDVVEAALNAPFARDGALDPFRFFCVDNGSWFHFGLAYDHVVAGGDSIVVLLQGIVGRYGGDLPDAPPARRLHRHPRTYGRLFLRHARATIRGLPRMRDIAAACRRSVRPVYPGGEDQCNGFVYRRIDPPVFAALLRAAKGWNVTVNDVLLAMLLKALDPLAGTRDPRSKRHELGVASIVNLRRDLDIDPNATFGQFLSSFRVSHPMPPGIPLGQLARDVQTETARIKRDRLYLQSLLAIAASGFLWRFLSPEQRRGFYAKSYPVWGAISMLDVDALWAGTGAAMPPPEYVRAIPTGPLAPVVVAATTAGNVMHLGFSWRSAAFSAEDIGGLASRFLACATELAA